MKQQAHKEAKEQEAKLGTHKYVGVKGSKETARWIWNHHFAAVAGDSIAFEVVGAPAQEENEKANMTGPLGKSRLLFAN